MDFAFCYSKGERENRGSEGGNIHIPIPIGRKRIAAVHGTVWKFVSCIHCREAYAYRLELDAIGEDHDLLFLDAKGSAQRAREVAERNLVEKSRNVVLPVPCPACGCYQDDMARDLKERASFNPLQIVGVVIALVSLLPLAFDIPYLWVITIVMGSIGLSLVAWGMVCTFRFNPNAGDPEPRKALGRKNAIRGKQLKDLLATKPSAESTALPDSSGRT